jgi:hypothetical protein
MDNFSLFNDVRDKYNRMTMFDLVQLRAKLEEEEKHVVNLKRLKLANRMQSNNLMSLDVDNDNKILKRSMKTINLNKQETMIGKRKSQYQFKLNLVELDSPRNPVKQPNTVINKEFSNKEIGFSAYPKSKNKVKSGKKISIDQYSILQKNNKFVSNAVKETQYKNLIKRETMLQMKDSPQMKKRKNSNINMENNADENNKNKQEMSLVQLQKTSQIKSMNKESVLYRTNEIKSEILKNKINNPHEALFFFIKDNNFQNFQEIFYKFKGNTELVDSDNNSLLNKAVQCNSYEIVKYLLSMDASVNSQNVFLLIKIDSS